ncbi:MAG: BamA/TamA family outer membrane protein [Saprospiraceae bacterium]
MIYKKSGHFLPFALCFLLFAICQSACNVTKHLDEAKGERLLVKNSIELKSAKRLKANERTPLLYELTAQYKQIPNSRPLIFFRAPVNLWLFYWSRDKKSRFTKWVNRKLAEPPTIFDEVLTQRTASNFQNYLQQNGYFNAKCSYEKKEKGKYKIEIKYLIELGPMHTIEGVQYESRDSQVLQILREQAGKSLLKRGEPMAGRIFDAEKARITNELRDRGYAYFAPNFVEFEGDSVGTRTSVTTQILTPGDSLMHQTYTIGNIEVLSSVRPDLQMAIRRDTNINGIFFRSGDSDFDVKPSQLYKAVAIKPLWPYRQSDFENTIRHMNELGVFRFVSVKPFQDSIDPRKINVEILTTPNKRISFGADIDLNSSTSSSALARNLLGIASSVSFRNRNLFRGAEHLYSSLQYNIEFDVATRNRFIFSQEFKWQNQLTFPRFFDYFGLWRSVNRFGKKDPNAEKTFYYKLKNNGQTRLSANYNYLNVIDFYDYNLFNMAFGYDLVDGHHRYAFDHTGIDVLRPRTQAAFDSIFGENQFLINSFGDQLFTGFFLRAFTYTYSGSNNRFGERWFYRFNTDLSGLEELALNRLWSAAFGKQNWRVSDLDFAQYLRLDMDAVYTRDFRKNLTGAVRVGAGVVVPFGDTRAAPYVKQYFVGGPTSLRAWRIREIGPGGYIPRDPDTGEPDPPTVQPFYQSGDFRFEFNGELRFNIFSWFKGAIFLDGGNVWTLKPDVQRPGSQLRWDSYKNIALGTGLGIRGDFSYLIIRFDAGLRLRNPYADTSGRYWVRNLISGFTWSDLNPNLAVGLPF